MLKDCHETDCPRDSGLAQLQAALEAKEKDLEATQLETAKTKQQLLEEKDELKKVRIA